MASPIVNIAMSEDAYFEMLELRFRQHERGDWNDKYEYWNGVAVLNAGTESAHFSIQGDIYGKLFQQLRGKDCQLWGQAVKLAGATDYVYPDATVVCGKPEYIVKRGTRSYVFDMTVAGGEPECVIRGIECLLNPSMVLEVMSPSTASMDQTDKLLAYTGIDTVREYLVVSSDRYLVQLFARQSADETWSIRLYQLLTDRVNFESCGCSLTLAEIYSRVEIAERADVLENWNCASLNDILRPHGDAD